MIQWRESTRGPGQLTMSENSNDSASSKKRKFEYSTARKVADEIVENLKASCLHITVAGSVRRRCALVSDIEIVYVPKTENRGDPGDLFAPLKVFNIATERIDALVKSGFFAKRENKLGRVAFGESIKLMTHTSTGIPVDLFATTPEARYNYLVCRTGPKESNIAICEAAKRQGWKWKPYTAGFVDRRTGEPSAPMRSEEDVFRFLGLPYYPPEKR